MSFVRSFGLISVVLMVVACGGGPVVSSAPSASAAASAQPSSAPSTAPTVAPTVAPSSGASPSPTATASEIPLSTPTRRPSESLDPSQSDAGVAAGVTITNDTRGGREGTYEIYGVDADGSECDGAFDDPDFIVVAWDENAPEGEMSRLGVQVAATDVPAADGQTTGVDDGGVSFDFEPAGFGTTYSGNATRENEGSSVIDVTRVGSTLTFDFSGTTWDGVNFAGQFVCADG